MRRGVPSFARVCLLLAALAPLRPAAAASKAPPGLFPKDERLARTVSVRAGHVYLGELLENLSHETALSLTVEDTKGPVSGIQLSVFVKDLPLRQVMAGLVELFSQRHDRWEWKPISGERKGYRLRHQRSPQEAAAAARQELLDHWSADLRAFHRIARLPERGRDALTPGRPDLFPKDGVYWDGANLFGELTEAEVDLLLHGARVALDRSRLSPRGRKAYDHAFASMPRSTVTVNQVPGVTLTPPKTEDPRPEAGFYVTWDTRNTGPVLWSYVNDTSENVMGGSLWDSHWQQSVDNTWRARWAPEVQDFLQKQARGDPSAGQPGPRGTLPQWIRRAAEKQGLNALVDPVYPHESTGQAWMGRTPEQTVFALVTMDYVSKTQGDLYLLRHISALAHPRGHLLAWPRVKALRQAAERNDGYLGLPQLLTLAELTPDQLAGLVGEFPDADSLKLRAWRAILQFYLNLDLAARGRVQTAEGLPFRDAGLLARRSLDMNPDTSDIRGLQLLAQHPTEATVSLRLEAAKETRQLVWEVRAPGTAGHRATLVQKPWRPFSEGTQRDREDRERGGVSGRH